ncbi:receptor-type tyrosine-protein phosphatase H-like isoform X3 [Haliotis rufescens]|uniref:receptor-type tyrosine-protein phosphatase H-like isoform X3 n=1 Tax=Haliotis rufescens TaxID=6454 RepID=UPI00201EE77C|nr:receptor-type tyrosine-protein phosphatase H-like isoform X3 [Haliotis rufescens]
MAICAWVVTAGTVVYLAITTLQDTTTDTPGSTTSMMEATDTTSPMSTTTTQDPSASTSVETDASTSTSPATTTTQTSTSSPPTTTQPPTSPTTTPPGRCRLSRECGRGAFCIMSRCTCAYGSYRLGTQCVPSIPVGGNCTNDTRCMAPSTCYYSVCTCPGDYYQKDQQCEARVQVGGGCNNNSECVVNVDCINNTCTCQADLFFKDGKCIPRVLPGEDCSNSMCVENAECVSSTCQCKHGFMILNGSSCTLKEKRRVEKLVVSGQTSSSVLVAFDGPLDYNTFRIDYNSSDPPKCVVLRRNSSQEFCSECRQVEDVEPSTDKRIEYNVTGLKPFTTYEFKVVMEKCNNGSLESSRPENITARTTSTVPNAVEELTTCTNKRCLVCAKWKPPQPHPGPVTYRVEIFDEVNSIVAKASNVRATSICYTKGDVNYFLKYTLGVTTFTTAGKGKQSNLTSMEIHFLEFKIVTAEGDCRKSGHQSNNVGNYSQMTIVWSEPQIGTSITSFILVTNGKKRNIPSEANGAGSGYNVPFVVTPGSMYTFKIQVNHNGTLYNVSANSSCLAPIGVPPEWPHGLQPSFEVSENFIKIKRIDFFNNSKNGAITKGRLYISTKKETLEVPDLQSGDVRATKIECCNGGFIKDCTAGYCRRGLEPDTEYYYLAVACTKTGCRQSPVFQFRTYKDNTNAIVVGMLVTSIIVAATIIAAALLWRSKKVEMVPIRISLRKPDLSRIPRERPILLSEMEDRVTQMHADSNLQFTVDYENIIRISPKHTNYASQIDENKQKNRWVNVLPFDHSRVVLEVIDDDETSDYINASYMPGYNCENEYIASQGPLPGTVDDFWRMIWEKKVSIIVMVTPVKENGKVKCEEYWPAEVQEPKEYGDIVVENTSFSSLNTYNVTMFKLSNGQDKDVRVVQHFHFLNWKDMSADVERSDILDFVRTVRSHLRPDMEGPLVIHCSAGVGRTGTFICLDYLIQFIEKHGLSDTVDIYGLVMKLRNNRVLMVQTETQYVFIHDCAKQLMEEKRLALERPDSVVDVEDEEEEEEEEEEAVYVNTEIGVPVSDDGMTGTEMTSCKDRTGEDDGCELYENASTCRLIQQTEL